MPASGAFSKSTKSGFTPNDKSNETLPFGVRKKFENIASFK
jgi:hypothetical protein